MRDVKRDLGWAREESACCLYELFDVRLLHVWSKKWLSVRPALDKCNPLWRVDVLENIDSCAVAFSGQDGSDKFLDLLHRVGSHPRLGGVANKNNGLSHLGSPVLSSAT